MTDDRIFAKCAWRLIPLIAVLYLVNYIDRVNVGFAAVTMNRDLAFSPSVFGFGAGVFFLGYLIFQIPVNVILHRVGASRTVFCILASWGVLSASCAFVHGPLTFYFLRFLLGAAEAGFVPGMLLYLTYWFPPTFRVRYTAAFQTAIPMAFVMGGPLSGVILGMNGIAGLHGWQWLFLLEGLPAILLAFAALNLLPDRPGLAPFLSADEKRHVAMRLAADDKSEHRGLRRALRDPRILALSLVLFGDTICLYGIQLWLPQFVTAMGFSGLATGFIVAIPFVASVPAMILWGRHADHHNERCWHVAIPLLLTAAALTAAALSRDDRVTLVALWIAAFGPILALGALSNLPGLFLGGEAAAGGIALYNSLGNIGGFVGPFVIGVIKQSTGSYSGAMVALAAGGAGAAILVLALRQAVAPRAASPVVARA